jgi:hypothetical protein
MMIAHITTSEYITSQEFIPRIYRDQRDESRDPKEMQSEIKEM